MSAEQVDAFDHLHLLVVGALGHEHVDSAPDGLGVGDSLADGLHRHRLCAGVAVVAGQLRDERAEAATAFVRVAVAVVVRRVAAHLGVRGEIVGIAVVAVAGADGLAVHVVVGTRAPGSGATPASRAPPSARRPARRSRAARHARAAAGTSAAARCAAARARVAAPGVFFGGLEQPAVATPTAHRSDAPQRTETQQAQGRSPNKHLHDLQKLRRPTRGFDGAVKNLASPDPSKEAVGV